MRMVVLDLRGPMMRIEPRRHPGRKAAIISECLRRLQITTSYNPSPYVIWFLPHVMAWVPDVTAKEAITLCRALYDIGWEIGRMKKDPDICMGIVWDTLRISRVPKNSCKLSWGYRFISRARKRVGTPIDKYIDGFALGFDYGTWTAKETH